MKPPSALLSSALLTMAVVLGAATPSLAAAITGNFSLTGVFRSVPDTVTIDAATGLNFVGTTGADNGSAPGTVLSYQGGATGGVLDGLTCATPGACGTIADIPSFSSFSGANAEFVLTNGLSFDLTSILGVSRISSAAASNGLARLDVMGVGTYHLAGYSDTQGAFTISASGNGFSVLFQASGTTIPEPVSLGLLGTALAATGLLRQRRRTA